MVCCSTDAICCVFFVLVLLLKQYILHSICVARKSAKTVRMLHARDCDCTHILSHRTASAAAAASEHISQRDVNMHVELVFAVLHL